MSKNYNYSSYFISVFTESANVLYLDDIPRDQVSSGSHTFNLSVSEANHDIFIVAVKSDDCFQFAYRCNVTGNVCGLRFLWFIFVISNCTHSLEMIH